MTAKELLQYELNDTGYQLENVFKGVSDENGDERLCDTTMTPKELIVHLCDCYQAAIDETAGRKPNWGGFQIEDRSWSNLWSTFQRMRAQAVQDVLASEDEAALKRGFAYIAAHDAYHVGQMASLRLREQPDWDPYSIYQH